MSEKDQAVWIVVCGCDIAVFKEEKRARTLYHENRASSPVLYKAHYQRDEDKYEGEILEY